MKWIVDNAALISLTIAIVSLLLGVWNRIEQWSELKRKNEERKPKLKLPRRAFTEREVELWVEFENPTRSTLIVSQFELIQPSSDTLAFDRSDGATTSGALLQVDWQIPPSDGAEPGRSGSKVRWRGPGAIDSAWGSDKIVEVRVRARGKFVDSQKKFRIYGAAAFKGSSKRRIQAEGN